MPKLEFLSKSPFSQKLNITTLYSKNWTFFKIHEIEYTSSTMFKKTLYWWNWISSFPYMWGKTPIWIERNLISIPPKRLGSVVAYRPPPRLGVLAGIKKYLKDRIIFCIFFINIRIYEYKFIYFGKVIDWNAHTIIHFENKCTFCEVLMYCAKVKYNFCQNILKSRFRNLKNMFQLFFFHFISRSGRASTWSFCDIYEKT